MAKRGRQLSAKPGAVLAFRMLIQPPMQKWNQAGKRVREAGSARGFFLLIVMVIGCLWEGGNRILTALTNRQPTVMSYDAYAQARPSGQWLVLTNCQLNVFEGAYLYGIAGKDARLSECYVPVHGVSTPTAKSCVLLRTSEPDILATAEEIRGMKNQSAMLNWATRNPARSFPKRSVQGVVSSGLDLTSTQRDALARAEEEITAVHFIILNANAEPSLAAGISFSAAGFATLLGMVAYSRRKTAD